ncbi:MAG: enoyl-CoA hydratase/isomerase family protein [Acidimicrobiia bacterium]
MSESASKTEHPSDERPEDMVLYEMVDEHVVKITLNRPHRKNAIKMPEMNLELHRRFIEASDDDNVKCIILAATGTDFCSGEDVTRVPVEAYGLKKGEKLPQSYRIRGMSKQQEAFNILRCDKTVVAACQGAAYGLGFNFALQCDMIIAAEGATFSRRQTRIGFAGFDIMLPLVMMKLGINRAYEVIMTGRRVSVDELKDWGVVASVVPRDQLEAEALRYAKAVALHSTDGLMLGRQAKKLFWDMMGMGMWQDFVSVAHPLFTNLVWRDDETNLLKERNRLGSARAGLDAVHKKWEELGFD